MKGHKLFICHSSKDKLFVRRLRDELKAYRQNVWLDENEIKVGDSIFYSIEKGLIESDYVLIVLSKNFNLSSWAREELDAAFNLEIKHNKRKILPCVIEDNEIPTLIMSRKYADFRKSFTSGLIEIIETLTPKEEDNPLDVYAKNSIVTLDIIDEKGIKVKYKKEVSHISLIDNLKKYNDCLDVAGSIENLNISGAQITRKWNETGLLNFEIQYPKILNKGDESKFILTADFIDSFTLDTEYWETISNNHMGDNFRVIVKFPKNRPPKKWYRSDKIGTKYFEKKMEGIETYIEDGRHIILFQLNNPVNHTNYILKWDW